jgi:hypothetical protein
VIERDVIPHYPGAVALNGQRAPSVVPGGGGGLQNWASGDAPDTVVAFFAERLGASAPATGAPWPAAWHLSSPDGSEHHLEVWPADGAYPFRDDLTAPPPSDARTVVHESSYLRPPVPAAPEIRVAPTKWRPAPVVWMLAIVCLLAVIVIVGLLRR